MSDTFAQLNVECVKLHGVPDVDSANENINLPVATPCGISRVDFSVLGHKGLKGLRKLSCAILFGKIL